MWHRRGPGPRAGEAYVRGRPPGNARRPSGPVNFSPPGPSVAYGATGSARGYAGMAFGGGSRPSSSRHSSRSSSLA